MTKREWEFKESVGKDPVVDRREVRSADPNFSHLESVRRHAAKVRARVLPPHRYTGKRYHCRDCYRRQHREYMRERRQAHVAAGIMCPTCGRLK